MEALGVVQTASLLPGLHGHLMALLRGLTAPDWSRPTLASAWTVRDIAAHLLDGQVRRLSFQRDGHPISPPERPIAGYGDMVGFLNQLNADWIRAARRLSPEVLVQFLEITGPQTAELFGDLDPAAPAFFPVAWAGEEESQNWFDVGREYTEWWHHQAQIREAVGAPPLTDRQWLHPLLELSMKAFCRSFADVPAAPPAAFVFEISGEAGGLWSVVADEGGWTVWRGEAATATARARCDADTAWRLFFNALPEAEVRRRVETEGDEVLIRHVGSVRGVMV